VTNRRERGTGSLVERPPGSGRWALRVWSGPDPVTGKPRQLSRTVRAKNVTEARAALRSFADEVAAARATVGPSMTTRRLVEEYIAHSVARARAPRTIQETQRILDLVIGPAIGSVPIWELDPRHIDELYRKLLIGEDRPRAVSANSVRRYHAVLSAALAQAVRWGWLDRSPADRVTLPEVERKRVQVPTVAEVATLIRAAGELSPVWGLLVKLAVVTGARRGELCALRWTDIDLEAGVLHIRRSLYRVAGQTGEKGTKGGRERTVALDPATAWLLDDWRKWCEARAAEAGVEVAAEGFIASSWPDCSRPLNVDTFSSTVGGLCAECTEDNPRGLGIPHVHLHSLRHFAATELLAGGVSPSDTAHLLGHADGGQLALRTYAHATDERQRRAAGVLARALDAGSAR